jgi:hypothetical protein
MKQDGINLRTLANMAFEINIFFDPISEDAQGRSINRTIRGYNVSPAALIQTSIV